MNTPQPTTTRLSYSTGPLQFGEMHLPVGQGPHPVVILIHGGFWRNPYDYTLMNGLGEDLATRGIAAWNIEYRRIGDEGGGWPGTFLDVAMATDFLRAIIPAYHLDPQRIIAMGHSAGGHLALWLAARQKLPPDSPLGGSSSAGTEKPLALTGVVSLAGVNDLELSWKRHLGNNAATELLNGGFDEVPERYVIASPASMLPLGIPQVLVHGTADDSVPYEMSTTYLAKAQAAGDQVKLITLEGEDHLVLINAQSEAWEKTVAAIRELMGMD